MKVNIKRVYEEPSAKDGKRILIDRLWPRGLTKEKAKVDLWLKDIAPSTGLREWFGHDPGKWPEFQKRYEQELKSNEAVVSQLRDELKTSPVTLVFSAKDELHNDAEVLKSFLEK
ncbi:MAG TPA: DUF488 domain-containing protein [Candidatus Saccharimonadales bacterium]|nr:DUF488 domain-containing protein [Candidatus Saccharimonadales bacterium]